MDFPEEIWVSILEWIDLQSYVNLNITCSMMHRLLPESFIRPFIMKWRVEFLMRLFPFLILNDTISLTHAKKLLCWIYNSNMFCKHQNDVSVCFDLSPSKGCNKCESSVIVRGERHIKPIPWSTLAKDDPIHARYVLTSLFFDTYPSFITIDKGASFLLDEHHQSSLEKKMGYLYDEKDNLPLKDGFVVYETKTKQNTLCRDYRTLTRRIFLNFGTKFVFKINFGTCSCETFESELILLSPLQSPKVATTTTKKPIVYYKKRKAN